VAARIEPWGPGNLELLQQLMGDPAMTEHLGGPESPEKIADRQARYEATPGMFTIIDGDTGEKVGSVGFWDKEWRGGTVYEVGWSVIPAFQGRGLASAATALLLEKVREAAEHRYVHAFPSAENAPSNGICRKLGFELLEAMRFEYPPASGNWMLCNDWRLDLSLPSRRDGEASPSA